MTVHNGIAEEISNLYCLGAHCFCTYVNITIKFPASKKSDFTSNIDEDKG